LLARVRWPDVFQAISPARPHWRADPGLFDLPYDPASTLVTRDQAEAIAAQWGAQLPSDDANGAATPRPSLMRRMPANWSDLSRAEKHAWAIDPAALRDATTVPATRWWRRRRAAARLAPVPAVPSEGLTLVLDPEPDVVIDLTDTSPDRVSTIEGA
jgi:hypothetical protein